MLLRVIPVILLATGLLLPRCCVLAAGLIFHDMLRLLAVLQRHSF
jgi:hypothetical protein